MVSKNFFVLILLFLILCTNVSNVLAQEESKEKTNPWVAWTVGFPFKVVGATLSSTSGLIVGGTSGFFRGAVKGSRFIAGKLGNEDGVWENVAGTLIASGPSGVGHSVYGGFLWFYKGAWIGFVKPLEYPTIRSALEGIPEAIEETADEAAQVFSS